MKRNSTNPWPGWVLRDLLAAGIVLGLGPSSARAQLEILPDNEPQQVFAGAGRKIPVLLRYGGDTPRQAELHFRLHQASSATTIPFAVTPWKKIQILPGQTVVESAAVDFPEVKAETRFLVQWLEGTNKVIGTTEVLVYPLDLLKDLRALAGDEPLGVLDPQNELKPLLKISGVEFADLEEGKLENFTGKLSILGPLQTREQMHEGLASRVKSLATRGGGVVWLLPPSERRSEPKPSFYTVRQGRGAVVVAEAALVANLAGNPHSELNLLHFARLALHPEPARLPFLTGDP